MHVSAPKREVRVSPSEPETRIQHLAKTKHEVRVYQPKHKVRVPLSECETHIQPLTKQKCKVCVSLLERETRVEEQGMFKHHLHVSTKICEVRIQPPKVKRTAELENSHPHGFEAGSSDTPTMDLRDYLIKK